MTQLHNIFHFSFTLNFTAQHIWVKNNWCCWWASSSLWALVHCMTCMATNVSCVIFLME